MHLTKVRKTVLTESYRKCGGSFFWSGHKKIMKEFGLYKIKPSYLQRFGAIDASLSQIKGSFRPFICVKLSISGENWLVPIASINPADQDYVKKVNKYTDLLRIDKMQAAKDKNCHARAIDIFKDLTGLQTDPNFRSIVEYYSALPVKHKYCLKYRDKSGKHIVINDPITQIRIKRAVIENIKAKKQGKEVGFIKAKLEEGKTYFTNYQKKSLQIREELYKEHFALRKQEQERKARANQRSAEDARRRTLRDAAKGSPASKEKIEIEPLHVYKLTDKNVLVKLPGANVGEKIPVWLPKDGVAFNKDGDKVIGAREDLQQKHALPLPKGQPKRFLK